MEVVHLINNFFFGRGGGGVGRVFLEIVVS